MLEVDKISHERKVKKAIRLCVLFARNKAYYRASREDGVKKTPSSNFWNTLDGNFIDMCVIEWCKVFADPNGKHH